MTLVDVPAWLRRSAKLLAYKACFGPLQDLAGFGSASCCLDSVIVFHRSDGVRVLYAHVQEVRVRVGDTVRAGQPVARVGNNGPAYMPHTHVGAYRGSEPLQIRFDLRALSKLSRLPDRVPP